MGDFSEAKGSLNVEWLDGGCGCRRCGGGLDRGRLSVVKKPVFVITLSNSFALQYSLVLILYITMDFLAHGHYLSTDFILLRFQLVFHVHLCYLFFRTLAVGGRSGRAC